MQDPKTIARKALMWLALVTIYLLVPPYYRGIILGILLCRSYYILRTKLEESIERWVKNADRDDLE